MTGRGASCRSVRVRRAMEQSTSRLNQRAAVSRALLGSTIGADGTVHTRAEYRLTGPALDLSVEFAPGVQPVAVWWDRRVLKLPAPDIDASGSARYEIVPDRVAVAEPLL